MISVIIIDDHPLVLNGFEFILKNTSTIVLRGSFSSAKEAFEFLATEDVDVVLMDINMPDMNGIDATEIIIKKYPNTQVIAISNLNEGSIALRMLKAGAMGYLLKNVSTDELLEGIEAVMRGQQVLSKEMSFILTNKKNHIPIVSQREREVLTLMAQGYTTAKIGEQMFISPLTVESQRRNLLQKFGVVNSASLIHKATEMKFI